VTRPLAITASTLGCPPFRELVAAAAGGGFSALSIWPAPVYAAARQAGSSDAELRAMLSDGGVAVNDIDAAVVWVGPDDPGGPYFEEAPLDLVMQAGEALRAAYVNVLLVGPRSGDLREAAAAFARVCKRASEHGMAAHLEFSPTREPSRAARALALVERAGWETAGLLIDTWHHHFGADTFADLAALPGQRLLGVQVSDAPAERPVRYAWATRHHRLVPGEGVIDLVGLFRLLDVIGSPAPLTLEVFNEELLASGSAAQIALRLGRRMRELQARAAAP
jgi:sugar phosphate isomerase/epimerase